MKYLKPFNESIEEKILKEKLQTKELQEFCDMNLAYLTDEGFKTTIESDKYLGIHLYHTSGSNDQRYSINFDKLTNINKKIYENNIKNNIIYCDIANNNIDYTVKYNFTNINEKK